MYLHCDDDISDTDLTMMPTLLGGHANFPPRYFDEYHTNTCNVGYVIRTWYGDQNYNNHLDQFEPSCEQTIYLAYRDEVVNINFPSNVTLTCLQDIGYTDPVIQSGPCDLIGISHTDFVFDISAEACKKIIRKFTVIDWCTYDPNNPLWNGEGIWYHDQIIKVIDKQSPEITSCNSKEYAVDGNCQVEVTLSNSAADVGNCPSQELYWTVLVDLWADGTTDYEYGYDKAGIFKITPKKNNEEVKVKLPIKIGEGHHKAIWKVKDGCGNYSQCTQLFTTLDVKPPTPYCITNVTATIDGVDGWPLKLIAKDCDKSSFDNCTLHDDLRFSFSSNIADSIKLLTCTNIGQQDLKIYVTDRNGNYDFCKVNFVLFDNGSCPNRISIYGRVSDIDNAPIASVEAKLMQNKAIIQSSISDVEGMLSIHEIPLYENYAFEINMTSFDMEKVDLFDYLMLQNHLLGKIKLSSTQLVAADLDNNNKVGASDLKLFRTMILTHKSDVLSRKWDFIPVMPLDKVTLSTKKNAIWLGEYAGNLDFTGIMKADIHRENPEKRDANSITCSVTTLVNADGTIHYEVIAEEDVSMDGAIVNTFSKIGSQAIEFEKGDNRYVCTQSFVAKKGSPLLIVEDLATLDAIQLYSLSTGKKYNIVTKRTNIELLNTGCYPNPAHDNIIIQTNGTHIAAIKNAVGTSQVFQCISNLHETTVDVSTFAPGIYFVSLVGGKTLSFVKQ